MPPGALAPVLIAQGGGDGARVAGRAVEPDDLDTAMFAPGDADRQVEPPSLRVILVKEPESRVIVPVLERFGKSVGSARQIRYGIPLFGSAPIEPYLK